MPAKPQTDLRRPTMEQLIEADPISGLIHKPPNSMQMHRKRLKASGGYLFCVFLSQQKGLPVQFPHRYDLEAKERMPLAADQSQRIPDNALLHQIRVGDKALHHADVQFIAEQTLLDILRICPAHCAGSVTGRGPRVRGKIVNAR